MMDRYQEENRGIQIIELENSFQMCTKKEYYEYLINIAIASSETGAYRCHAGDPYLLSHTSSL